MTMMLDGNTAALEARELSEMQYEAKCPVCDICGETITDIYYYDVDGDIMCEGCFDEWCQDFRKNVEDYVEERSWED